MTPLPLTGKIPGLLRDCSPVILDPSIRDHYGGKSTGVVFAVGNVAALVTFLEDCRPLPIPLAELTLDMLNPAGRFHAKLYLQEQGYDAGNEDRADVLAWSVLSVHRGGKLLQGVATLWEREEDTYGDVRCGNGWWVGVTHSAGWEASEGDFVLADGGPETDDAGKAACDAALLRLGYAVTNNDGTITFPPLPEGAL